MSVKCKAVNVAIYAVLKAYNIGAVKCYTNALQNGFHRFKLYHVFYNANLRAALRVIKRLYPHAVIKGYNTPYVTIYF